MPRKIEVLFFEGCPTLRVDGVDIEPEARRAARGVLNAGVD